MMSRTGSMQRRPTPNRTSPSSAASTAIGSTIRASNTMVTDAPTSSRSSSNTAGPSPSARTQPAGAGRSTRTSRAAPSPSFVTTARTRTRSASTGSTNVPLAAPSSTGRLRTSATHSFVPNTASGTRNVARTASSVRSSSGVAMRACITATTSSPGATDPTATSMSSSASNPSPSRNATVPGGLADVPRLRVRKITHTLSPGRATRGSADNACKTGSWALVMPGRVPHHRAAYARAARADFRTEPDQEMSPTKGGLPVRSEEGHQMIDLSTLRRIPLFRDFNDEQLSQVLATVSERRFPKHQFVVREGEPGDTFFVIASGSVAVCRISPDGRETILSILKEGDFFGEMSMFDSSLRSASIKTLTDVEVGAVRQVDFLGLIDRNPQIGRLLVIELSERLRAANALIAATASQDIRARLAALLLNLAEQFGEAVDNGTRITLRLTNQEMANMIGTTRETVNRTLNRFWDDRLVDMRTAHVVVTEPDKLRALIP